MGMSDLLTIESISVAYGKRRALDGVSLTVAAGEIVTLLGANGSGKSTTLRTISGLVRPARGHVVFDGRDITRAAPDAIVAAGVAHVPEGREIFPQFTVYENLLMGGFTASPAAVRDGIERAFALFPVLRGRARTGRRSPCAGRLPRPWRPCPPELRLVTPCAGSA